MAAAAAVEKKAGRAIKHDVTERFFVDGCRDMVMTHHLVNLHAGLPFLLPNSKFLRVFNQLSINQKIALVVDGKNLGLTTEFFLCGDQVFDAW